MANSIGKTFTNKEDAYDDYSDNDSEISMDKMSWFRWMLYLTTLNWEDVLMIFTEKIELIDWDHIALEFAEPVGHILTVLFFLIRYFQDNVIKPNYSRMYSKGIEIIFDFKKSNTLKKYGLLEQIDSIKSQSLLPQDRTLYYKLLRIADTIVNFINIILVILNIYICYKFFFGYFKSYSLFYVNDISNKTNHVEKKLLSSLKHDFNQTLDELEQNEKQRKENGVFKRLYRFIFKNDKKKKPEVITGKDYYFELTKWAPTKFITHIFMSFSPLILVILFFSTATIYTLVAISLNQLIFHLLIKSYNLRIVDDSILSSATMDEYQMKAIKPRWTRKYQDISVDATHVNNPMINFSTSVINDGIFETHSLNGTLIRERYSFDKERFEKINN